MTRHSRAVALAAAFVFLAFVVAPSAGAEDGGSTFRVENADLDLGTVVAGTVATAKFVFVNDGPDDVHIIRAKPS